MQESEADLVVIGAGSAGLSATAFAAQLGVDVVLIERSKMGGECLNVGCVPSKALLAAAKVAHAMRSGGRFGITAVEPVVDFEAVHAHVQGVIAAIAPHDSVERFEGLGARVLRGEARFVEPRVLVVQTDNGDLRIRARRVIVATGSAPAIPPIEGLDSVPYFTNETLFDNRTLPEHLLVIGGGPIGIEMAQAHRRLGAKVTVVERGSCLSKDDPEHARQLLKHLATEGVVLRQKTSVKAVRQDGEQIVLTVEEGEQTSEITGSHLLVATGRKPRLDTLDLERAGVKTDRHGIVVDAKLRTNVHGIYAIGDVISGAPHFTHTASFQAGIAVQNALLLPYAKTDYSALPWVTYCDPELAHVGIDEAEAKKRHGDDVQVLRAALSDNDRAQTERATLGSVKVLARKNGTVLGVSILASHAGEMAHAWGLAIGAGLKLKAVATMIAPYPTFGEAGKAAAGELYKPKLFSPLAKRVVRWFSHLP
ncbi:MAG: FAD-dependent oxidoreductase [Rubrivivax sp.]